MSAADLIIFGLVFVGMWFVWKITQWLLKIIFLLILTALVSWYFDLIQF